VIGSADLNFVLSLIQCNGDEVSVAGILNRVFKVCISHLEGLAILHIRYVNGFIVSDKDPLLYEHTGSNEGYHRVLESDSFYGF
jgi:hypothetical protein